MYFNLIYEITEETTRVVTEQLLILYEKYRDDETIFPKEIEE